MSKLAQARVGRVLRVRQDAVEFSFWPMQQRGRRRWGLHSMLYASDPWAIIEASLREQCSAASLTTAESFVRQAKEYFASAENSRTPETKPLLYYYSFLSLGKALGLARGRQQLVGTVRHGLSHAFKPSETLSSAELSAYPSTRRDTNAFHELYETIAGAGLSATRSIRVQELMAQSLVGHRLWREASNRKERFVGVQRISLLHDATAKQVWAVVEVPKDGLARRARPVSEVLEQGSLLPAWACVSDGEVDGVPVRRFEQVTPLSYAHRPSDHVMDVVKLIKPTLWRTVTSSEPYRRYYLYLSPSGESRLPQLLGVYALMYFLGSLTRYRPEYLLTVLRGPYGAFIYDFLASQPQQFVFGISCEFKRQEVSRAAVV